MTSAFDLKPLVDAIVDAVADRLSERFPASAATQAPAGWLATPAAAKYLHYSEQQLQILRVRGGGPRYSKGPGRQGAVRYAVSDLDEYMTERMRRHTADTTAAPAVTNKRRKRNERGAAP